MSHLIECPECSNVNPSDARYCVCGRNLATLVPENTAAAVDAVDADNIGSALSVNAYPALHYAIPLIRCIAVLVGFFGLIHSFNLPKDAGSFTFITSIMAYTIHVFFIWVSSVVIQILLDIRGEQHFN